MSLLFFLLGLTLGWGITLGVLLLAAWLPEKRQDEMERKAKREGGDWTKR